MQPDNTSPIEICDFLKSLFAAAVEAANPANCLPDHLPNPPKGRTLLIAAGKAAASMARAAETNWPANAPMSGTALTRYGHAVECETIQVIEAAHPVPDNRGYEAAVKLLAETQSLTEDDLLLFLVSGGGSSLLALPAADISLEEKKAINKGLLESGAPIGEMNTVRKHLSAIKGGKLAQAAHPAGVVTLAISDVPFDDPSTIASGPTVPDPTSLADTFELIERYALSTTDTVNHHLAKASSETPIHDDPAFKNTAFKIIAKPSDMLSSVVEKCRKDGFPVTTLGADLEGEARQVGIDHARRALKSKAGLILSGGETTVTVEKNAPCGRGGRNCEYLLSLAIALDGAENIYALAADTDGIDGSEDNAGAIIRPNTLLRAKNMGLDAQAMLDGHDAYTFFDKLGDLIVTGPTLTNVNDFRAIWVG